MRNDNVGWDDITQSSSKLSLCRWVRHQPACIFTDAVEKLEILNICRTRRGTPTIHVAKIKVHYTMVCTFVFAYAYC